MPSVLLVGGSPNHDSKSSRVLQVLGNRFSEAGVCVDTLTIRDLPAGDLMACTTEAPDTRRSLGLLDGASGVVLATPIYKSSISGLLKLWLDLLSQHAFRQKIILPVATGGSMGSMLALDAALAPIVNSMGSLHVFPGLFILEKWISKDPAAADALALPKEVEPLFESVLTSFVTAVDRGPLGALSG